MINVMNRQFPKVVVVSVFYNREDFVLNSVQSLLDQTYPNLDIVLVNDGSTDNTLAKLSTFISEGVKVETWDNQGFTKSIRKVLSNLSCKYVAIHGAGDISERERIQRQVDALESDQKAAFCGTASANVDPNDMKILDIQNFPRDVLRLSDYKESTPATHGSVMYRYSSYLDAGGYDDRLTYTQDWDLWLRLLTKYDSHAIFLRDVLYKRLSFPNSASNSAKKSIAQLISGEFVQLANLGLEASGMSRDQILNTKQNLNNLHSISNRSVKRIEYILNRKRFRMFLNSMKEEECLLKKEMKKHGFSIHRKFELLILISCILEKLGLSLNKQSNFFRSLLSFKRYIN